MKRLLTITPVIILPLAILLWSCGNGKEAETSREKTLVNLEWMLGTWESTESGTTTYEQWMKKSPTEFSGRSFRLAGDDTLFTELLTLAATDSGTFYIDQVAHTPEPSWFKYSGGDSTQATFENPMHDFPTRLVYSSPTPDSLVAVVEGDSTKGHSGFVVHFERVAE
jgi:hypothetical protein